MKYINKFTGNMCSLKDIIIDRLDGDDYDRGISETALETSCNNSFVLLNLIDLLLEKKLISEREVLEGVVECDSFEEYNCD